MALKLHTRHETDPQTIYMILLVLYATGLRPKEALALTFADVDLHHDVFIRDTKNFKTRLVPFSPQLANIIKDYVNLCKEKGYTQEDSAPFFSLDMGEKFITTKRMRTIFRRLRKEAHIERSKEARYQPRLMGFQTHICSASSILLV